MLANNLAVLSRSENIILFRSRVKLTLGEHFFHRIIVFGSLCIFMELIWESMGKKLVHGKEQAWERNWCMGQSIVSTINGHLECFILHEGTPCCFVTEIWTNY